MRFKLIKLLCIIGAGILGAVLVGDPLAAVLTAPFGWIVGKTIEVWSQAGKVPVRTVPVGPEDLSDHRAGPPAPLFEALDEHDEAVRGSGAYSWHPSNIFYDSDV